MIESAILYEHTNTFNVVVYTTPSFEFLYSCIQFSNNVNISARKLLKLIEFELFVKSKNIMKSKTLQKNFSVKRKMV